MNDFLDNLANHQYGKMIEGIESESVEVEDDPKAKRSRSLFVGA